MSVALAMITKNSASRVGPNIFRRVLQSSLQIPYNVMIIVNDGNDKTSSIIKEFADEYNKELIITRSPTRKSTRAIARQTAINVFLKNTSNEWLFFPGR